MGGGGGDSGDGPAGVGVAGDGGQVAPQHGLRPAESGVVRDRVERRGAGGESDPGGVVGYEQAPAVAPGLAAAHRNLGALHYGAAMREETAHGIFRATHLDFKPAAFFDGVAPPAGGYPAAAVEHLERALQLAPGDEVAGYFLERARSQ